MVSLVRPPCTPYTEMPGDAGDMPLQLFERFSEALVGVC
jgi:hypothetical protein